MNYSRVLPRDAFNEAKLLKCIGRLSLLIHDEKLKKCNLQLEDESKGFIINQLSDGSIECSNLTLFDDNGTIISLSTLLNSKLNYPMTFDYKPKYSDESFCDFVFNKYGEITEEFKKALSYQEVCF